MNWLQVNFITPPNLILIFMCWSSEICSKKMRKGAWIIWHAVIWVVWKTRNDIIFNNKMCAVDDMVEQNKTLAWHWNLNRSSLVSCVFYEWCCNPNECLNR